jgi:hypothetical protein
MQKKVKMRTAFQVLTVMLCLASGSAMAQAGLGLRVGGTADPNQFHFGAHYITNPLFSNLTFRPNLEIGIGSDVTTFAANFEFAYGIPMPNTQTSLYIGAGPALNVFSNEHSDNTDTGGGFNILVGLEHKNGLFGEVKVGAFDSPEFKLTVGYTF